MTGRASDLVLAAAPIAVALAYVPGARDPYESAKVAVTVLLAGGLVAAAVIDAGRRGKGTAHRSPLEYALGAFAVAGLVAVLTAPGPVAAVFGVAGRYEGWLLYIAGAVLAVPAACRSTIRLADRFATLTLAGLVLLGLYGLLQLAGIEPLSVSSDVTGVFVTLSNPNFAGGWAGSLLGLACWRAASGHGLTPRALGAAGVVSVLVIVLGAGSAVGFVAAAASAGVMGVAWLWHRGGQLRRLGLPAAAAAGVVGAALVGAGVFEAGPLGALGTQVGVQLRRRYWEAAVDMLAANPVTGVGFDGFIWAYRTFRSPEAANQVALTLETDSAHSVPLQLASGGGAILLLAYVCLCAVVLWAAVSAIRRHQGQDALLVAAVASVWVGITAQALASYDLAAHVTLFMVTAGLLGGLAWPAATSGFVLPGATRVPVSGRKPRTGKKATGRPRSRKDAVRTPEWMGSVAGVLALAVVGVALWIGTRPLLAERAAGDALRAEAVGATDAAAQAWRMAAGTASWEPDYPYREGLLLLQSGDLERADDAFARALERQPDHFATLVSRARGLSELDRRDEARELYRRAYRIEPNHIGFLVELVEVFSRAEPVFAREVLARIEDIDPDTPELGDLRDLVAG